MQSLIATDRNVPMVNAWIIKGTNEFRTQIALALWTSLNHDVSNAHEILITELISALPWHRVRITSIVCEEQILPFTWGEIPRMSRSGMYTLISYFISQWKVIVPMQHRRDYTCVLKYRPTSFKGIADWMRRSLQLLSSLILLSYLTFISDMTLDIDPPLLSLSQDNLTPSVAITILGLLIKNYEFNGASMINLREHRQWGDQRR